MEENKKFTYFNIFSKWFESHPSCPNSYPCQLAIDDSIPINYRIFFWFNCTHAMVALACKQEKKKLSFQLFILLSNKLLQASQPCILFSH